MPTPKEIFEKMEERMRERAQDAKEVNAVYKFVLSGSQGGTWIVDMREDTLGVREGDEEADCTINMSDENFVKLVSGKLNPQMALVMGRIKISGDMGLAMKLGKVLR